MNKKNIAIMVSFSVFVISAMTALGLERMKVTRVCRDQRLWMDGSYSATVESGGLNRHSTVILYKQVNLKRVKLGETDVNFQRIKFDGALGELYFTQDLKLFFPDIKKGEQGESLSSLKASLPHDKIDVKLLCAAK